MLDLDLINVDNLELQGFVDQSLLEGKYFTIIHSWLNREKCTVIDCAGLPSTGTSQPGDLPPGGSSTMVSWYADAYVECPTEFVQLLSGYTVDSSFANFDFVNLALSGNWLPPSILW